MSKDKLKNEIHDAFVYFNLDCDSLIDLVGAKEAARALG